MHDSPGDYPTVGQKAGSNVAPSTLQAALDQVTRESEEKSLLLNELRHRMKNNLQTVQSLLRLQKSRMPNSSTREGLAHLEMQIAALNGVDGELLVAEAKHSVDLGTYLRRLVGKLKVAFDLGSSPVVFWLDVDSIEVPCSAAANIGLLVNEAITNSFKHAVPRGASEIRVALRRAGDSALLTVSDNGPGFDGSGQGHVGGTLLMRRLAEKARATVERDIGWSGTRYIIRIRPSASGTRSTP